MITSSCSLAKHPMPSTHDASFIRSTLVTTPPLLFHQSSYYDPVENSFLPTSLSRFYDHDMDHQSRGGLTLPRQLRMRFKPYHPWPTNSSKNYPKIKTSDIVSKQGKPYNVDLRAAIRYLVKLAVREQLRSPALRTISPRKPHEKTPDPSTPQTQSPESCHREFNPLLHSPCRLFKHCYQTQEKSNECQHLTHQFTSFISSSPLT